MSPLIRLYLNIYGIIYMQQKPNVQIIVAEWNNNHLTNKDMGKKFDRPYI